MAINDYIQSYNFQTQPDITIDINDFYDYKEVSITCEWSGLKGLDAVLWIVTKDNASQTNWIEIPLLNRTLDTANGVCKFICRDFNFKRIGIEIIKNTCYYGTLNIYVNSIANA